MEQQQQEVEISFKLDSNGRTISSSTETDETPTLCYDSRSVQTELWANGERVENASDMLDELLYDCEISDCGLMPRTFWMPSKGVPRCSLEQMALSVFQHHVGDAAYDPETSGAEYWVQIRPSPPAGRYTMHDPSDTNDLTKEGISFHWDKGMLTACSLLDNLSPWLPHKIYKDEEMRLLCGGKVYIHPHLSTVTYLTDIGAPTLALNYRVHNLNGEYMEPDETTRGFVSWPKFGKHLSFDGRYLHAAPADLMEEGAFQKQCQMPEASSQQSASVLKKLQRRYRRVTFLVNIWLNYKPFDVNPFPDTMITKLSGHKEDQPKVQIKFVDDKNGNGIQTHSTTINKDTKSGISKAVLHNFRWPMGDCNSEECIKVDIPLKFLRKQAATGGSLDITWKGPGVKLCCPGKGDEAAEPKSQDEKKPKRQKIEP